MRKINESYIFIALLFILTFILVYSYQPICPGVDFYVHHNRYMMLKEALLDGSFPIYMDYDAINGYGYIIKIFYSDFMLIPFALIGNLINDPNIEYGILTFVITFLCALFTYIAMCKITHNKYIAILTAILYSFSIHRLEIWQHLSGMGEIIAMSFIPLVLWGAYEIIAGNRKKWYILTIAICCITFSHLLSTIITLFILTIFFVIYNKRFRTEPNRLLYLLVAAISTVFLTSYYIFPMLEQMLSNSFYYETNKLTNIVYRVDINYSLIALLNSAISKTQASLGPHIGSIIFFPLLIRFFIKDKNKSIVFADICAIVGICLFVVTTSIFPWDSFPFNQLVILQFSWRLYTYISLLFAIAGSCYMINLTYSRNNKYAVIACFTILSVLIINNRSIQYKKLLCDDSIPVIRIDKGSAAISAAEYLPSRIPTPFMTFFTDRGQAVIAKNANTTVSNFHKNKGHITFDAEVTTRDELELPLTYYLGYSATLDGEEVQYQQSDNGLIEVSVNKSGQVEVLYTGTTLQKVSYYITIISIILLVIFVILNNRKTKKIEL